MDSTEIETPGRVARLTAGTGSMRSGGSAPYQAPAQNQPAPGAIARVRTPGRKKALQKVGSPRSRLETPRAARQPTARMSHFPLDPAAPGNRTYPADQGAERAADRARSPLPV